MQNAKIQRNSFIIVVCKFNTFGFWRWHKLQGKACENLYLIRLNSTESNPHETGCDFHSPLESFTIRLLLRNWCLLYKINNFGVFSCVRLIKQINHRQTFFNARIMCKLQIFSSVYSKLIYKFIFVTPLVHPLLFIERISTKISVHEMYSQS